MLVFDGDYPMALAVAFNRDLTRPIEEVRSAEPIRGGAPHWSDSQTMASLPEMRRGRVTAALVKIVVDQARHGSVMGNGPRSDELSYARGMGQAAYYRILETKGEARILRTASDVASHIAMWEESKSTTNLPVGLLLGMEGSDPILWPDQLDEWYDLGVRVISIGHYGPARYGGGTGTGVNEGLYPGGAELLRNMDKRGVILDVTHTSDRCVREALAVYQGPILASHQNCRALVPGERQQPDDILKAVIDRGGVIGTSLDTWMLTNKVEKDWSGKRPMKRTDYFTREDVSLEDVANHIDYVNQLAGNSLHSAVGGDTDGQGGAEGAPVDVDTVADYMKLVPILQRRGYQRADIENVMYRNWQRFFEKHLP
ncbi:MAG: peptidase M19 [SAR202 cluster bacterium]|nr:peptidase M19 [SAR202 cluster bacterium]